MNGRFQMQGGKNWIFAEIDQRKPVLLGLSLAGIWSNHLCPSMETNGVSVATDPGSLVEKPRIYAIWTKLEHVMIQATEEKNCRKAWGESLINNAS
jgi:hypothetical protein